MNQRPWVKFSRSLTEQLGKITNEIAFVLWLLLGTGNKERKCSIILSGSFKSLKQILEEKAWLLGQQGKDKRSNWRAMTQYKDNYKWQSHVFACILFTNNHMISLVQFVIKFFQKVTNCTLAQFGKPLKNLFELIYPKLRD